MIIYSSQGANATPLPRHSAVQQHHHQQHRDSRDRVAPMQGHQSPGIEGHRGVRTQRGPSNAALICFLFTVPSRPVEVCYTVEKNESWGSFVLRLRWQVRNLTQVWVKSRVQRFFHHVFHRTVTPATLQVVSLDIR